MQLSPVGSFTNVAEMPSGEGGRHVQIVGWPPKTKPRTKRQPRIELHTQRLLGAITFSKTFSWVP